MALTVCIDEWARLVQRSARDREDDALQEDLAARIIEQLTHDDLASLVSLAEAEEDRECYEAFGILRRLMERNDRRLVRTLRERACAAAASRAELAYPWRPIGQAALVLWHRCDKVGVEAFLMKRLQEVGGMSEADAFTVVLDLTALTCTPKGVEALRAAEDLPAKAAGVRDRYLRRLALGHA